MAFFEAGQKVDQPRGLGVVPPEMLDEGDGRHERCHVWGWIPHVGVIDFQTIEPSNRLIPASGRIEIQPEPVEAMNPDARVLGPELLDPTQGPARAACIVGPVIADPCTHRTQVAPLPWIRESIDQTEAAVHHGLCRQIVTGGDPNRCQPVQSRGLEVMVAEAACQLHCLLAGFDGCLRRDQVGAAPSLGGVRPEADDHEQARPIAGFIVADQLERLVHSRSEAGR